LLAMAAPAKALAIPSAKGSPAAAGLTGSGPGGVNIDKNKSLGQSMAAAKGWTGAEWLSLLNLWTQESGWSNTAQNPSSGAYGIVQALPPTKLPFAGQAAGGSQPGPQITWGLDYIAERYGDPNAAWAHEMEMNWYERGGRWPEVSLPVLKFDQGGMLPTGATLALNQTGKPEPVSPGGVGNEIVIHNYTVLDGKVVGQATQKAWTSKYARR
ncbi:MAG: hypothetical protein ACRDYC_13975, partial [Acidimicrobiales bacterium]